jgi:hypothetical protein
MGMVWSDKYEELDLQAAKDINHITSRTTTTTTRMKPSKLNHAELPGANQRIVSCQLGTTRRDPLREAGESGTSSV